MSIRQVIVMRKDLNMRKGKIAAQAAHASLAVFFRLMLPMAYYRMSYVEPDENYPHDGSYIIEMTPEMVEWKEGSFTKICVYVESEEELLAVYNRALEAGLPAELITDNGLTEFNGVPTLTCAGIGPACKEDLDPITGHLPLY